MKYKQAGVDVQAGYKAVELMRKHVASTHTAGVIGDIGGFGGLFAPDFRNMKQPVLVSGTDGVGTKLKMAFLADKHDTIGIDCVAMCVNDILCCGAVPLFFLDYIACGKNYPEKIEQIVKGIAKGCVQAECALIGGETAEMPGFYKYDEYDLAGFAVGMVDKEKIIDGSKVSAGDVFIGLSSSGIHSNGYSLIRKAMGENIDRLQQKFDTLSGTLLEELLTPTKIYVKTVKRVMRSYGIKAMGHITGGGLVENIPRMYKKGLTARLEKDSWPVPPVFDLVQNAANIDFEDMLQTFNMGIGMVMVCDAMVAPDILRLIETETEDTAYRIGTIIEGNEPIILC